MNEAVLVDTGPLVAFLNRRDRWHEWSKETFAEIAAPVLTCEAVISEACFLLRKTRGGSEAVLKLVERGPVRIPFRVEADIGPLRRLLGRFEDVPMALADACLVRMSEQIEDSVVLTLDRDFRIYRKHGRQVIPTRMPAGL